MSRVPTEKQYDTLRVLGSGAMLISGIGGDRRLWKALLRHGWVAPEKPGEENGLRITAEGYRALAAAADRYGLPDIHARREDPPEPPLVQRLRAARDEARQEAVEAQRELHQIKLRLTRAQKALEGEVLW